MKSSLSVFIITLNAAKKIEACLQSVAWADEIILVDSGSTDQTLDLAKKYGAKIFSHPFINFADQKNYALGLCSGEWVFSIDSDEVVTPELKSEIESILASKTLFSGFAVPRRSMIFGRIFRYSGTQSDAPTRLVRRGCGVFEQPIHEVFTVNGALGRLQHVLMHYTYDTAADYFERFNRYTDREAGYLLQKNYRLSWIDFCLKPPGMFLKLYFAKQGFRDGWEGFLFCLFSARYVFTKYSKYSRLRRP